MPRRRKKPATATARRRTARPARGRARAAQARAGKVEAELARALKRAGVPEDLRGVSLADLPARGVLRSAAVQAARAAASPGPGVCIVGVEPGPARAVAAALLSAMLSTALLRGREKRAPTARWRDWLALGLGLRCHPEGERRHLEALSRAAVLVLDRFRAASPLQIERVEYLLGARREAARATILVAEKPAIALAVKAPALGQLLGELAEVRLDGGRPAARRKARRAG